MAPSLYLGSQNRPISKVFTRIKGDNLHKALCAAWGQQWLDVILHGVGHWWSCRAEAGEGLGPRWEGRQGPRGSLDWIWEAAGTFGGFSQKGARFLFGLIEVFHICIQ